jgi:Ca2+-binding RTX toxin-like protein
MFRRTAAARWTPAAIGLGALIALICMPPAAPFAGAKAEGQLEGSRVYAFPYGRGGVTLQAGDADSEIAIRSDDSKGEMVITDQAGVRIDGRFPEYASLCNQVSDTRVRCSLFDPGGVRVGLGEGNDSIEVESTHHAPVVVAGYGGDDSIVISTPPDATSSRIQGNGGADLIVGGPSNDRLRGGSGPDILAGAAGDDLLSGKGGNDRFGAGAGDDRIKARHNDADHSIECGSGDDSAEIDRHVDPRPVRCERVRGR